MWKNPMEPRILRAFRRVLRDETDPVLRSKAEKAIHFSSVYSSIR